MKIYTRTGDDGTTGLFGGGRVPKYHPRIQAMGAVDETNAALGVACAALPQQSESMRSFLLYLQRELFVLGADLATPEDSRAEVTRIQEGHVKALEKAIDNWGSELEHLQLFILPGGTQAASMLHLARGVCRRAERLLAENLDEIANNPFVLHYLNRLSDLLFVLARRANYDSGMPDVQWIEVEPLP
ncbi:MAG: cob(I)yrinic acid a,c-diamide adenosyltransferase [Bacteroidetes bacterium]|nr:cob(I)yrinic acid a,c-diamide adenosyltransferase [Bacteroidota bacterium]MDE2671715.1 cob(I)yrinic acid a,c-diamide adenosyltransferase [Bacteroidota bacterium]